MSAKPSALPPSVPELTGVWHRSLLVDADGHRDTTTAVTWVQGPVRYADLRQPSHHPRRPGVSALSGLGFEELLALTRQEAFAGRLRRRSDVVHWARTLGFGPVTLPDDYECFTLLRPTAPVLELMNGAGEWIDAPPLDDCCVVNTVDLLELWTNGEFAATSHRVRKVAGLLAGQPLECPA
ncbi:2OG-Fe(II) oxygenase family protein [Streptomyces sp. NPDC056227]|uniref:2OG-Fe(II) oxygenase family protein n=1 Tax=Streptomyces sp. NPDC056227 TaxID=3345753 RepID=UPI0035DF3869